MDAQIPEQWLVLVLTWHCYGMILVVLGFGRRYRALVALCAERIWRDVSLLLQLQLPRPPALLVLLPLTADAMPLLPHSLPTILPPLVPPFLIFLPVLCVVIIIQIH